MDNKKNDFVHFYQSIDVLIIDDVQFLCGKEKTQDVFFHIFNHLHQNKKQVILTADKAPVDIIGMEQRLLSRFKWGLSADLQSPALETRLAILKKKIKLLTDDMKLLFPLTGSKFQFKTRYSKTQIKLHITCSHSGSFVKTTSSTSNDNDNAKKPRNTFTEKASDPHSKCSFSVNIILHLTSPD